MIPFKYLYIYLGILFLAAITGARHGWDLVQIRVEFMNLVFPVLGFYLFSNVLNDRKKIEGMLWVVFIGCIIKSTILDIYYMMGRGILYSSGGDEVYRIVTNDSGDLMVFITMILLAYAVVSSGIITGVKSLVLTVGAMPMLFAVIFSFRRGHWVGMLASAGILFLWSSSVQRRKTVAGALVIGMMVIPAVYLAGKGEVMFKVVKRFSSIGDPEEASNVHHLMEARQTLKDILETPIVGLGLGSLHTATDTGWENEPRTIVHNTWIYFWMKMGLLGLIFFVWAGVRYVRQIIAYVRMDLRGDDRPLVLAIASTVGLWMIMFLSAPVPWYFHQTFFIALFSSIVLSLIRMQKSELSPQWVATK